MRIEARAATEADIDTLLGLYRALEEEMIALHPMWPLADGLDEPINDSLARALKDSDTHVLIGEIEDVPFGFLLARFEGMLAQTNNERICAIRLIYVDHEAREVSVGEVMRNKVMEIATSAGITKFDAHVLPGHRLAKNFFEAGGFSARSIIMHHDAERE